MKRVFFPLFVFLIFPNLSFAAGCVQKTTIVNDVAGMCTFYHFSLGSPASVTDANSVVPSEPQGGCRVYATAKGGLSTPSYPGYVNSTLRRYQWSGTSWLLRQDQNVRIQERDVVTWQSALSSAGGYHSGHPSEIYPNGIPDCGGSCDTNDDDSDGVCNECDLAPGQPDKDDCLLTETIDKDSGQLTAVAINRQCDGTTVEFWQSENYNPVTARPTINIGASAEKLGKQNCQVGLPAGQCCAYGAGSPGQNYTASLSPQENIPPAHQEILDSLIDLPSFDDVPDNCASHNSTCKQYCQDKLGVALSYCRDGDGGKKVSDCKCNNDFAYSMASPDETTQDKVDQVNEAVNKDSNSNGVPDYADAGTQNKTDTDNDGIHDQADVDQTGGLDTNGDGIDDKVTAEAHANAVASSGLSEADSRNLDAIEQSTAQTASGVEGVKNSMDQVVSKADDLLEAADSALAESQAIRDHLDTFTEDNTGSLSTIEQTLNDGPFSGLSQGDIPDDPTSQENFDVDSFVREFSFAFPDEMKDLIEDSKIETTASDSCIKGIVMGQQIEFCFNQFHSIFVAMGVLFQGLCVFRAFGIVVGGFGR